MSEKTLRITWVNFHVCSQSNGVVSWRKEAMLKDPKVQKVEARRRIKPIYGKGPVQSVSPVDDPFNFMVNIVRAQAAAAVQESKKRRAADILKGTDNG
ncbi:MAG: hypothetical protein ACYTE3_27610 [Planctomycetota bacterium]